MSYYRNTDRLAGILIVVGILGIAFTSSANAQVEPIEIPLSQPGQAMTLEMRILSARITVIGEDRDNVSLETAGGGGERRIITPSGSKPINAGSYSLSMSEKNNVVSVSSKYRSSSISVIARVPRNASLKLSTTNNSVIDVRDVTGDMELQNINGPITVVGAAGSVIAESVNETVSIGFSDMRGVEAASLSTMNGDLIIGVPEDASCELHIDTSRGEITSDLELTIQPTKPVVTRSKKGGGTEISIEKVIVALINGGGPVIRMKTLNGDIEINKVVR